jgi:hypothetical protein
VYEKGKVYDVSEEADKKFWKIITPIQELKSVLLAYEKSLSPQTFWMKEHRIYEDIDKFLEGYCAENL